MERVKSWHHEPLKIAGAYITRLIREKYAFEGEKSALKFGHEVIEGATDDIILKIATGKAEIGGVSPDTYYRETE